MPVYRLQNVVQPYAWGSTRAIADLIGQPVPSAQPQAELWMGTHPKGPSMVIGSAGPVSLASLIDDQPAAILGDAGARRFCGSLPFLFKVLAAARPLSIQAHPNIAQAREGFARENTSGKAMDAFDRNYRDANHKPEILCALTPFWAMSGFRPVQAAKALLVPICPDPLAGALERLEKDPEGQGLRDFFERLMTLPEAERQLAARQVMHKAGLLVARSPVYRWIVTLADAYPGDMGLLSPALLNLICLRPGQAVYLPAGQLHAYLEGMGIELMANSDNVLRGGLTPKHVDVPELLRVVRFAPVEVKIIHGEAVRPAEKRYPSPAAEFSLGVLEPDHGQPYHAPPERDVEILLCTAGDGTLIAEGQPPMTVKRGDSFLVPAAVGTYEIQGRLTLYKAGVP
ncbi:mannose-6-phosphate isomerase, class I [Desulfosarcina ovata]|uniref:mannose-6-phosphate isomerase n=1 Tax=Desulfosarcina ovata subsp. ovata TaxID=2752305 RepID=A0A5K8A6W2_9BACT|nr:mannose-6-phosphate isomerase, class I [Desulfosarcina ovata]BBO88257.1 mannose-6-phosphate isomerase, class I [Desulfosarcina ovata subsp. ovata]